MQAEANAKRRDRRLPEVSYVDPTAHTGRAITPEELEYKKKYTDWVVQQFANGRKGGGIPSWKGYQILKDKPGTDLPSSLMEYHDLGIRKRDEEPVWSPEIDKVISRVHNDGGSPDIGKNPALSRWLDRIDRWENSPGVMRPKYYDNAVFGRGIDYVPNINKNTSLPYSGDYRPDNTIEHSVAQFKIASEEQNMITYTQAYMAKKAAMEKKATWLGRQINNVFGQDTFMGRAFGESNATAAENFFKSQEAPGEREARRQAAADYDARQAAINKRIDAGLAQAQQRLAQGKGITQQPGYVSPSQQPKTQVAAAKPAPRRPSTTPPPSAATTSIGKRQGYKTPDGVWHDIPAQQPSKPAPAPTTTNWGNVPKGHMNTRTAQPSRPRR